MRCGAAKGAVRIETRQEGEADACALGSLSNSCRHLGEVGIGRAVTIMMKIVELADPRIALLEHLDIKQGRDALDVFRSHFERKAIHRLAPCPEGIRRVATRLGKARHGALERVTVQARYPRNCQPMLL